MSARGPQEILRGLELFGIRLGLDTTRRLLGALGGPQRGLPAVLVAGTNGKGSTAAYLAAMGTAAGYRTGLYTSPHLETVEERVRVDGRAIAGAELAALLERVLAAAGRALAAPPTYFEALTAAAFLHFAERRVQLAVLEVGMGGRLDATNVAEPLLSLVTPISLDHREHLGASLTAIAREKAGVLRAGRPALAWVEEPEAAAALAAAAAAAGAPLHRVEEEVSVAADARSGWDGQEFSLRTPAGDHRLATSLLGFHQRRNLALAVRAAEELGALGFPRLDAGAIAAGAAACRWPGRLEVVPLDGGRRLLLDGAHNPGGVAVLASFLAAVDEPYDLLFGALADKDVAAMLPPLTGAARRVLLTTPPSPRAADPRALAELAPGSEVEPDWERALDTALAAPRSGLLVVCGSLYLVGDVRRALRRRLGRPPSTIELGR